MHMYMYVHRKLRICDILSLGKGFARDLRKLYIRENVCVYSIHLFLVHMHIQEYAKKQKLLVHGFTISPPFFLGQFFFSFRSSHDHLHVLPGRFQLRPTVAVGNIMATMELVSNSLSYGQRFL